MKKKHLKDLVAYQKAEIEKLKQAKHKIPSIERKVIIQLRLCNEHITAVCDNLSHGKLKELLQMHIDKENVLITGVEITD